MKQRISIFLRYYAFWLLLFWLQKPLFVLIQRAQIGSVSVAEVGQMMLHAFQLDLTTASYMAALMGVMMIVSCWVSDRIIRPIIDTLTGILIAICLLVFIGDNGTFPAWGYHIDRTIFLYLQSPREVLACADTWVWIVGTIVWIAASAGCIWIYKKCVPVKYEALPKVTHQIGHSALWLFISALLFLPIRGGVGPSTMNTGRVYFSSNQMLNIAAVNPVFNIFESLGCPTFDTAAYHYMPTEEAQEIVENLFTPTNSESQHRSILKTQRPDIIFLIIESLSANVIAPMGGTDGITPHLNRYCEEGVFCTNAYASSFRTDRGVVAVISGFPGQPSSSLMVVPSKCRSLPYWPREMKNAGYELSFFYGGDEDFTSMRSYLIEAGFDKRVSDKSFPVADRLSKWGVPDAILLDKLTETILTRTEHTKPTLDVVLTLSSHEPFDVPVSRYENPYLNGVAYTDSCIGALVERLRMTERWDSTLIIVTGDHGYPYPDQAIGGNPLRFRLPILFFGGAIRQPERIETVCSQIDIAPTLLAQLGLPIEGYLFGKDILDTTYPPFAFYSYPDGFGLVQEDGITVIDSKVRQIVYEEQPSEQREKQAQAFMQAVYEEIERL